MKAILYLQIIFLLLVYSSNNECFAKDSASNLIDNFYFGGSYGYEKKVLEFKTGNKYLDFDTNNVFGYNLGLSLGYICTSFSSNNLRTELEFMYIAEKKFINEDHVTEELLKKRIEYWNNDQYKIFFNLYYDIGNFFAIRDLIFYFGLGINIQNSINQFLKNGKFLDIKSNIMIQNMIGIKYKLLSNIAIYSGYKYFINYLEPKEDNVKYYSVLGSYGLTFGLEFIF